MAIGINHQTNTVRGTDSLGVPKGTTAQRPTSPVEAGHIRWNTSNTALEVYDGTRWIELISDYFPTGSTQLSSI